MKNALLMITLVFLLLSSSSVFAGLTLQIEIKGLQGDALKNAQERLTIEQQFYGTDLTEEDIADFMHNAPDNIRQAIEPFGYFKPQIISTLTRNGIIWTVHFSIKLGPLLRITAIDLNITGPGQHDPVIQKFIRDFPLKTGQVLQTLPYEKAKNALFQTVNNQGYLKAFLTEKEIRINLQQYTAVVILHLNTGSRYYFGHFTFSDNPFAPEFLQRFIYLHENEPFSSQKLLKFQQDLSGSHYFRDVTVTPELEQTKEFKVPIRINILAPKAKEYKAGIGYGTFTGPRVMLGADFRRLTNTGQHLNVALKLSPVLSGLAAKYFIPGHDPLTEQYTFGINAQKFVPQNGKSFSQTIIASYVKNVNAWQRTLSVSYINENYKINNQPSNTSRILYPSFNIAHIEANDMINPTSGHTISFNIQGAKKQFFSTTSFIQTEMKGKIIFSPTSASRIILRGDFGYTVVNDLSQLPLSMQFFSGGPGSVRGYRVSSSGPGRYLKVASAEYQHRLTGKWSSALFYDVGTAANHLNDPLDHSRGIGIIYTSSIGPIRFYIARADTDLKRNKPLRIDFNIGPEF